MPKEKVIKEEISSKYMLSVQHILDTKNVPNIYVMLERFHRELLKHIAYNAVILSLNGTTARIVKYRMRNLLKTMLTPEALKQLKAQYKIKNGETDGRQS